MNGGDVKQAPLSKGAGCGESRRLGDCLEAGSRSRKAAQGGTLRVGGRFRGRHFGAGQSLRPRLAARPPPFDKGGKLRGGACNQPGNRDLDVIANPCRGRFYIGPVFATANTPGRIWNPPLQWFFNVAANRETMIRALPRTCVGADSISARSAAAQTPPGGYLRPKSRTCGPVGLRNAPAGAVESAPTWVFHGIRPPRAAGFL